VRIVSYADYVSSPLNLMNTKRYWLKRIALGLLALLLVLVLLVGGLIAYDALFGPEVTAVTNISYAGPDGHSLHGYLAQPDGPGPHPAVLLIHEWWGLNQDITALADTLAAEGYVVLAPDAYRGRTTNLIPRAIWLVSTTPQPQIGSDMDSALAHLRQLDNVDPARVGSVGFCFGGRQSLWLGLRQPEQIAATVTFYGGPETDIEALRPLSQPVLGIFGREDSSIPLADVAAFERSLQQLNVEHTVTIYDGVGHAFLNSENIHIPGPARDAWQQMLAFLNTHLQ
jgi:carboxymethylenebutenolidase